MTAWSVATFAIASAALVIGIVALTRPADSATTSQSSAVIAPSTPTPANTAAADRHLCEAVGPLLHESDETGKAFVNLGHTGTRERDAGIPQYQAAVVDWVRRIEPVAAAHRDADEYLRRTLQRMIDDIRLYAANIRPGTSVDADVAAWTDATVAYGGPLQVCHALGVEW